MDFVVETHGTMNACHVSETSFHSDRSQSVCKLSGNLHSGQCFRVGVFGTHGGVFVCFKMLDILHIECQSRIILRFNLKSSNCGNLCIDTWGATKLNFRVAMNNSIYKTAH